MRRVALSFGTVLAATCFLFSVAQAAPQTKDQQKCITKLNKAGSKVADKQGKENSKCIKFAGKGKLDKLGAVTAQGCLTTDDKGKVQKKKDKTGEFETKFCTGDGVPDFGIPTGSPAADINTAAVDQEIGLVADIFGDNLDAAVIDCDTDKDGCKCQDKVYKSVTKLVTKKLKEFLKCKKFALKEKKEPFTNGAASAADLETCVDDGGTAGSIAADTKGKIGKARDKVAKDAFKKCASAKSGPVDTSVAFPGACAGEDASGGETFGANDLAQCLDVLAECRVCLMINEIDNLNVDCDTFDDGNANGSCPPGATTHKCTFDTGSAITINTEAFPIPPFATTGAIDVDCGDGTLDLDGKAACTCDIQTFDPVAITGIGTVCIAGQGSCPTGEIDCDGGNDLSWDTVSDHNIGACTSNADCASQCDSYCPGTVGASYVNSESGCENFCEGGANDNMPCTQDTDCPGGACNGPDGGAHGNVCGCQCTAVVGPPSDPGDMLCQLPTKIYVVLPSGSPCSNPATIDLPPVCIPLTTGTASGTVVTANNGTGSFGNSGSGSPFVCNDLFNSVTSGAKLTGVVNFFDSTLGDLSVLNEAVCQ